MVRINNLRDSPQVRLKRDQDKQARSAPIGSSSVTRPNRRLRIGANGQGGFLESNGRLYWQGVIDLDGPVTITMSLDVSGDTVIGGSVSITEQLEVTAETLLNGLTTLMNDLIVSAGGAIRVDGDVPLTLENGIASFANGAFIRGSSGGLILSGGGSAEVQVSLGSATLAAGGNSVSVEATRVQVAGRLELLNRLVLGSSVNGSDLPTAPLAGVPSGVVVRSPTNGDFYVAL